MAGSAQIASVAIQYRVWGILWYTERLLVRWLAVCLWACYSLLQAILCATCLVLWQLDASAAGLMRGALAFD